MIPALLFLFALGLVFGSFSTMWTRRWATGEGGMVAGRSKCPSCGHVLGLADLVPLFSWLALRGKCRHCAAAIGWRYPLIEASMGLAFVFAGAFLADIPAVLTGDPRALGTLAVALALAWACVTMSAYDLEHLAVPSPVAWWGAGIAGALALLATFAPQADLLPWNLPSAGLWGLPVVDALLGAALAWVLIGGQAYASGERIMGKGDGDIALLIGAVCGWKLALAAVWFAYCVGGIVGIVQMATGKRGQTPFGQYLCAGFLLALAWGGAAIAHYARLLEGGA